jgi:hypothetical protein
MSRKEEIYFILGLIVAVMACIAGWLALLPQQMPTSTQISPTAAPTLIRTPQKMFLSSGMVITLLEFKRYVAISAAILTAHEV